MSPFQVRLSDGDVIGVVFKKDRPDYSKLGHTCTCILELSVLVCLFVCLFVCVHSDVVYKFQDLGPTPESQPGGEGGSTLDSTLEVDYREMEEELAGQWQGVRVFLDALFCFYMES